MRVRARYHATRMRGSGVHECVRVHKWVWVTKSQARGSSERVYHREGIRAEKRN